VEKYYPKLTQGTVAFLHFDLVLGGVRLRFVCSLMSLSILCLASDFSTNKRIADEYAVVPTKRVRNKIAGFATHLMKRLQKGAKIRGISIKMQEVERERRDNYVPTVSALNVASIDVDEDTKSMLKSMEINSPNVHVVPLHQPERGGRGGGNHRREGDGERPRGNASERGRGGNASERGRGGNASERGRGGNAGERGRGGNASERGRGGRGGGSRPPFAGNRQQPPRNA